MSTYEQSLTDGQKAGASKATDAQAMAMFLESCAQLLLGAVSARLIWQGAQTKGLTGLELATMISKDPGSARDLMWL